MTKYRIIGNMTGNSMDAVDLVLTEFDGDTIKDICAYTKPYLKDMQERMESLRFRVFNKTKKEIMAIPDFQDVHDEYVRQIADCINEMCAKFGIDKKTITAVGFHGKTLDHNPPSKAQADGTLPYTLQIGSGQMLADLTGIPVIYDFRSDFLMAGFEGAPLVPPHNAHIAAVEGDGCYYNGGNTSNFAFINGGKAEFGSDAGPFNEYTDGYIRKYSSGSFDKDGAFGKKGVLNTELLAKIFDCGRDFYEAPLPKSGDPAYYHKEQIFEFAQKNNIKFEDAVHTFEYAAAYTAVQALTLVDENVQIPERFILFGGGWKNPVVRESFENLLSGNAFILAPHKENFANFAKRLGNNFKVRYSKFGDYMEARLFADLARYKLENRVWEIPEVILSDKRIVSGIVALPRTVAQSYADCISRAAKGWQL